MSTPSNETIAQDSAESFVEIKFISKEFADLALRGIRPGLRCVIDRAATWFVGPTNGDGSEPLRACVVGTEPYPRALPRAVSSYTPRYTPLMTLSYFDQRPVPPGYQLVRPAGASPPRLDHTQVAELAEFVRSLRPGDFETLTPVIPLSAGYYRPDELAYAPAVAGGWLWDRIIPERGLTLLTATWKVGKTSLLAELFRAADSTRRAPQGEAGTFLGRPVSPANVLVVTEERFATWRQRGVPGNLSVWSDDRAEHRTPADWQGFAEVLAKKARQNFQLIVLDTLSALWPVGDENSAPEVTRALRPLKAVAEHAAVVLVHHDSKTDSRTRPVGSGPGGRGRCRRGSMPSSSSAARPTRPRTRPAG